jgi:hypothetical protein
MAMNPLMPPQPPPPGLGPVPGVTSRPYSMMPGQGGMGPGGGLPPQGPEQGGGEGGDDNVANIAKLMSMAGVAPGSPQGASFLAGLGVLAAKRLAAQGQPRGATDDPNTGPGGAPVGPEGGPPGPGPGMPPGGPPQGMPPIGAR